MTLRKGRAYTVRWTDDQLEPELILRGRTADIHVALNYGQSTGSAQMLRFVTEHTEVKDPE